MKAGYEILWSVHDELIIEVDIDDTTACKHIEKIMSTAPEWLSDCPIAAEAYEANAYTK